MAWGDCNNGVEKIGEDEVEENAPIGNIQFYKKKLLSVINGSYGKRKNGGGSLLRHLTAMFCGKRESYKNSGIREKNQNARG